MMNKVKKASWAFIFVILCMLCFLYPYSGDDWAWGSSIGIDRLSTWFDGYSGRYFGNLIVLALTRSNLLKTVCMSGCLTGIVWILWKISQSRQYVAIMTLILIFSAPKSLLRQSVVWTAGFSNYTTSIVLILLYGLFVRNMFIKNGKRHSVKWSIPMLLLGFLTALIVEHITLLCVIMGIYVIVFNFVRNKKIELVHLAYSVGTIIGAITMFSNSVYTAIGNGNDAYRSVGAGENGIVGRALVNYFDVIGNQMMFDNIILCMVMIIVVIALYIQYGESKKGVSDIIVKLSFGTTLGSLVYGIVTRIETEWVNEWKYGKYFTGIINILFWVSLAVFLLVMIEDKLARYRFVFVLGCIACATGPLLVVTPIGPRCFFATFVLTIWLIIEMLNLITINDRLVKGFTKAGIVILVVVMGIQFAIFGAIHKADKERLSKVRKAEAKGKKTVKIERLPHEDWIHAASPEIKLLEDRYKMFYGITLDLSIQVIERETK